MTQSTTLATTTEPSPEGGFLRTLIGLIRAEDSYGAWDKKSDSDLLKPFVLSARTRSETPIVGDPEPETVHRVELFYRAVALIVEQRSRLMASSLMSMGAGGSGRFILTVGKVIAHDVPLHEVHRFGFEALEEIGRQGEEAVTAALATIDRYPDAARD
jgi:probable nitrogen fixation protein